MLDAMTPAEFDEWVLDHATEPWGDDWMQASAVATSIINEIRVQLNGKIAADNLVQVDALIPKARPKKNKPTVDTLAVMRAQIGV